MRKPSPSPPSRRKGRGGVERPRPTRDGRGKFRPRATRAAGNLDNQTIGTTLMKDHVDRRACAIAARHLAILETQIVTRAQRITNGRRINLRRFACGSKRWSPDDECAYRDNPAALTFARRVEIDALIRQLDADQREGSNHGAMHRVDRAARFADNRDSQFKRVRSERRAVGRRQGDRS